MFPAEIWHNIAEHLSPEDIARIAHVCRLFSILALDRRFRSVILDDPSPPALLSKLEALATHAHRVRALTIHPAPLALAAARRSRPLRAQLIPDIVAAVARLDHLTHLSIKWPYPTEADDTFCRPLLHAIWPVCAHNLSSLRLEISLSHLALFVPPLLLPTTDKPPPALRALDVHFNFCRSADDNSDCGLASLAHLISHFSSTLASLSLSSLAHLDFTPLYAQLGIRLGLGLGPDPSLPSTDHHAPFPKLSSLSLILPCDPRHLTENGARHLNALLEAVCENGVLDRLEMAPQYCCFESTLGPRVPPAGTHSGTSSALNAGPVTATTNVNDIPSTPPSPSPSSVSTSSIASTSTSSSFSSSPQIVHTPPQTPRSSHVLSHSPFSTPHAQIPLQPPTTTTEWLDQVFANLTFDTVRTLIVGLNILGSGGGKVLPLVRRLVEVWAWGRTSERDMDRGKGRWLVVEGAVEGENDLLALFECERWDVDEDLEYVTKSAFSTPLRRGNRRRLGGLYSVPTTPSSFPFPSFPSSCPSRSSYTSLPVDPPHHRHPTLPIQFLEIETKHLTPRFLTQLAKLLPGLRELDLVYRWVGGGGEGVKVRRANEEDVEGFLKGLGARREGPVSVVRKEDAGQEEEDVFAMSAVNPGGSGSLSFTTKDSTTNPTLSPTTLPLLSSASPVLDACADPLSTWALERFEMRCSRWEGVEEPVRRWACQRAVLERIGVGRR